MNPGGEPGGVVVLASLLTSFASAGGGTGSTSGGSGVAGRESALGNAAEATVGVDAKFDSDSPCCGILSSGVEEWYMLERPEVEAIELLLERGDETRSASSSRSFTLPGKNRSSSTICGHGVTFFNIHYNVREKSLPQTLHQVS